MSSILNTQRMPLLMKWLGVAVAYALLLNLNQTYLTDHNIVSIFWLPSGLAVAVGLIGGKRYVGGVFFGALLSYLADHTALASLGLALGASTEALLGSWLLTQRVNFDLKVSSLADILKLDSLAGFVGTAAGALICSSTLLVSGDISALSFLPTFCRWWMGDALGVIVFTPLILVWQHPPSAGEQPRHFVERLLVLGTSLLVGQIVFMDWFHEHIGYLPQGYWMFMLITLVALRLGTRGTFTVILIVAVQGMLGALRGIGYFADDIASTQLVNYWFYMVVLSFVGGALATFISAERRDRAALRDQERFFRLITDNIDDFIAVLDVEGKRLYNSPSYAKLFGDTHKLLLTDSFAEVHPDDRDRVKQVFRETVQTGIGQRIEYRFVLPDGSIRQMESRGGVIRNVDGRLLCVAVVSHDITERKKADEQIYALAYYDALTQLPNRLMLKDRFNLAMATNKRNGRHGALIVLDLDNFKPVNDQHGHSAGDLLLKEAAHRIASSVREVDTVARFGGDEFVVILTGLDTIKSKSKELAASVAEKIRAKLAEPYFIEIPAEDGTTFIVEHHCTSSIGIAIFLSHETSQEDIFKWADMAMYRAKESGRNQIKFHE